MISLGPIIFGFILGVIIGSQLRLVVDDTKFTLASCVVIFIAGIIFAWLTGQFPFYNDLPLATGFFSALVGIFVGELLLSRSK